MPEQEEKKQIPAVMERSQSSCLIKEDGKGKKSYEIKVYDDEPAEAVRKAFRLSRSLDIKFGFISPEEEPVQTTETALKSKSGKEEKSPETKEPPSEVTVETEEDPEEEEETPVDDSEESDEAAPKEKKKDKKKKKGKK